MLWPEIQKGALRRFQAVSAKAEPLVEVFSIASNKRVEGPEKGFRGAFLSLYLLRLVWGWDKLAAVLSSDHQHTFKAF